jgi:hypothetical protein
MKKIPTVIFTLSLILAIFSACKTQPQQTPSPSAKVETSAPASATPKASAPAETTPKASAPAESIAPAGLDRGTWTGKVYTNDFAKIKFTLPEGWVAATDEEIAALMGQASDLFTDKQKWLIESAKLTTIYDMMVQDPETMNNISVMFENLSLSPGGTKVTEKAYLDMVTSQLASLETMTYTFDEPYKTKVNGVDYDTVRASEAEIGITQYYMVRRQDNYMVALIITVVGDTKIDDILANFK